MRCLHALDHPNVVKLLDVIQPDDPLKYSELALVFEKVDFDMARMLLNTGQVLTEAHAQYLAYQLLLAVDACHGANILHRDLKPDNVLVNEDCRIKLCDFNLAALDEWPETEEGVAVSPSKKTLNVVSPYYRAPELVLRDRNYGRPIDIWSVGCIFGELLQNCNPNLYAPRGPLFKAHNRADAQLDAIFGLCGTPSESDVASVADDSWRASLAQRRISRPVAPALEARFAHVSEAARDLLARMLSFDPSQRPTAREALAHPFFATLHASRRRAPQDDADPVDLADVEDMQLNESTLRTKLQEFIREYHPEFAREAEAQAQAATAAAATSVAATAAGAAGSSPEDVAMGQGEGENP